MEYRRYIVQQGDSIYKIAKNFNVEMTDIIELNHIKHPDRIYPGQLLLLPVPEYNESVPTEITEPNFTYAMWLYEAYAGKDSELSAITTYLYQAVILDKPEFDALLRPIIYDGMNHLDHLGKALRHLGFDPRYQSFNKGHWVDWRASYLNYATDICSMLELNIKDKAIAHQHYLDLAHKIPIPEIQQILIQMAADEERHCQCFAEAKNQFCPDCHMPEVPDLHEPYPVEETDSRG
jgi:Mn-containing catalase